MATRQTFCIGFTCRNSKADKKGLAPIELTISINGVQSGPGVYLGIICYLCRNTKTALRLK